MPPPPSARGRRERRGGDPDERLRRTLESQQAAYEASRAVLAVAAARRDAGWRAAARLNRNRALTSVAAPLVIGVLLVGLGAALAVPLLLVGAALTVLWLLGAIRLWRRPASGVLRRLGGVTPADAVTRGMIDRAEAERLVDVTEGLCAALGLAQPRLVVIEGLAPNALSLGRSPDDAALIVTVGVAKVLHRIELEAVLAHELAHVKRLDVLTAAIASSGLGTVGDAISGGRFTTWLQDDDREIRADLAAVSATRYPPGLIAALERIAAVRQPSPAPAGGGPPGGAGAAPPLDAGTGRRVAGSWLVPPAAAPGRPTGRPETELDDRLDVLREL